MNADLIFKAFGEANSDYLIHAEQSMTSSRPMPNRGAKLRFSLIAAAIVAIVMIPLTVIIANHYGITPPPIPVITTPEETYKSLTDIPGAIQVDSSKFEDFSDTKDDINKYCHTPPEYMLEDLKNSCQQGGYPIISGTVSNLNHIIIYGDESSLYAWSITTATITLKNQYFEERELNDTVRVISIYRIHPSANIYTPFSYDYFHREMYLDFPAMAELNSFGVFRLYPKNKQYPQTLFDETFDPYEYADYIVLWYMPILYNSQGEAGAFYGAPRLLRLEDLDDYLIKPNDTAALLPESNTPQTTAPISEPIPPSNIPIINPRFNRQ